ncbi:Ger(x)C family spore germination protein [Paratissierella segnis]|jgi:spore germination protein KC|uniref:Ger(X)C family spore germination protein n=1 Tax=Paratissierella segnis TaxID=2763679 RepID=A0A926EUZ9_9FIRM|nr:Ger(x)C family spore germination protein [Paratissierella segnis]MBC8589406.1 Ger(x)C family spore germination protein [Paratissierella segnis]
MKELNNLSKKTLIVIFILAITILLTSCTGGRELNTLGIVVATGLDLEDGKVIITNEVINPAKGSNSENSTTQENTLFIQGIGDTLTEAFVNTTLTFDRELYLPHSHIVIFGEELAKRGIGDYIDFLSRNNEQREQSFMLVALGAKAYDVMGINSGISQSPGRYIYEIVRGDIYNDETRSFTLTEFFKYFYRPHEGFLTGVLKAVEKPQINKEISENEMTVICVKDAAAFKGDKLIGYYTGEEMIGFNFIVGELKNAIIEFESPDYLVDKDRINSRAGKLSSVQVFRSKTSQNLKLIDGKLHLFIDVKFRGILRETTQGLDISQPGVLKEMENSCAKVAKSYMEQALEKGMKEFESDTFGIGQLVHRQYPDLWKEIEDNWEGIFVNLDYTVNVTARINDTGFTNTPPNIRKGKQL